MNFELKKEQTPWIRPHETNTWTYCRTETRKKAEECLNDILTLTVSTRYEGEDHVAARTELHFDGDIDMVLPKSGSGIDRETLDLHLQTVALAVKNRRELIRIFAELFDLKEVVKLI